MSEHSAARIEIGGQLPRNKLKPFIYELNYVGVGFDWGSVETMTVELLRQWVGDDKEPLVLMNDNATFGRFESLEKWLDLNKMSYLVYSESSYSYGSSINGVVDGVKFAVGADHDNDPVVEMTVVTEAYAALKEGRIFDAYEILGEAAKTVPDVPPFEIVETPRKKRK